MQIHITVLFKRDESLMRGKSFGRENYRLSLSTMAESGQTQVQSPLEELIGRPIGYDDATWILTSAFIIFTMQSGFGLIESGKRLSLEKKYPCLCHVF